MICEVYEPNPGTRVVVLCLEDVRGGEPMYFNPKNARIVAHALLKVADEADSTKETDGSDRKDEA